MKQRFQAVLFSAIGAMLLGVWHLFLPTLVNEYAWQTAAARPAIDEAYMTEIVEYHKTLPVFAARPLSTALIEIVHTVVGVGYGTAFLVVQIGLLTLVAFALYELARHLSLSHREALWSLPVFYTSYTILFAFFASIYTYDEPLQYLAIICGLIFLLRGRRLGAAMFFLVALIARETTLILFPALYWFWLLPRYRQSSAISSPWYARAEIQAALPLIIPLVGYALFYVVWMRYIGALIDSGSYLVHERFQHFFINFQNPSFALESLAAPFITVAIPALLAWVGQSSADLERERLWRRMTIVTFVINTPIVLVAAYARESRLFALPLLFLWPWTGKYVMVLWSTLRSRTQSFDARRLLSKNGILRLIVLCIFLFEVMVVLYWFLRFGYYPTAPGNFETGYRLYIGMVMISVVAAVVWRVHLEGSEHRPVDKKLPLSK